MKKKIFLQVLRGENMAMVRYFEYVDDKFAKSKAKEKGIPLPSRSTKASAGYDFSSPVEVEVAPNERVLIWTELVRQVWSLSDYL